VRDESIILKAATLVAGAQHVAILTGAGVSAESGLATYRAAGESSWMDAQFEMYATPSGFRSHPEEAWKWYDARRRTVMEAQPNQAHIAVAQLAQDVPRLTLLTQNVDGLHQRAGSKNVIELHGNVAEAKCFECNRRTPWPQTTCGRDTHCAACEGLLRPNVVFFYELLDADILADAISAAEHCDLFLTIGTSNQVEPVASLPATCAARGQPVVIVNTDITDQLRGDSVIRIAGRATEIMSALVTQVRGIRSSS
jgi:NAD-dependent deacetylase